MKLKLFFLAVFPLTLLGCQSSIPINKDIDPAKSSVIQQNKIENPKATLSSYKWYFESDKSLKPIEVIFSKDTKLDIKVTCNSFFGSYQVNEDKIIFPSVFGNMLGACLGPDGKLINSQDKIATHIFKKGYVHYSLDLKNNDHPKLTLEMINGEKFVFDGKMTPEYKYKSDGEIIFLDVHPEKKQCIGTTQKTCLQVKEIQHYNQSIQSSSDQDWTLFSDEIQGFEYVPNQHQIIRVKRYEIKNAKTDQPKFAYIYDMYSQHLPVNEPR
jgi:hypothetical protein